MIARSLSLGAVCRPGTAHTRILGHMVASCSRTVDRLPSGLCSSSRASNQFAISTIGTLGTEVLLFSTCSDGKGTVSSGVRRMLALLRDVGNCDLTTHIHSGFVSRGRLTSPRVVFSIHFLHPGLARSVSLCCNT